MYSNKKYIILYIYKETYSDSISLVPSTKKLNLYYYSGIPIRLKLD